MPNEPSMLDTYLQGKLNTEQYNAASYVQGHSLILAGAGSWKTRTLTYKIANLVYGHNVHPTNILAVTFTNKAANEMKERLQHIVEEIRTHLQRPASSSAPAEVDFDDLLWWAVPWSSSTPLPSYTQSHFQRIGTFHSVFLKILKHDIEKLNRGYTKQFTIYDAGSDVPSLIKKLLKEQNMTDRLEYREVHRKISRRKNEWFWPEQAGHRCENQVDERTLRIYQLYQKSLEQANALDFDDLLLLSKQLFEHDASVLKKRQQQFKYVLVDEAQDTNALQFTLMRLLVPQEGNITFIGDDYQSIYRRRGAVMDNFLNVKQRRPSIEIFKLETNYRSKPHIVSAWNAIIKNNQKQYSKEVVAHRNGNDLIRVFCFADETDEAIQVIELITKLKEEQEKKRSDFTILYRTNAQSSPFEQILLTEGIPYKVIGAFKFFERAEIKDMLSYIRYLLNPRDEIGLLRIINTPNRKIGKTSLDQIDEIAKKNGITFCDIVSNIETYYTLIPAAVAGKIVGFARLMKEMLQSLEFFTPGQLLDTLVKSIGYKDYLLKQEGEEKAWERMENIGQLINIAHKYGDVGRDALVQFMEEVSLMTSIEESAGEAPDAVMLMSIHASKGLEFPYVFVSGLEENIFPLPKAKFDDAELEEERRAMYVAITRAKDHLFLSYAQSRQQRWQLKYNQPSRFIEELPEDLLKRYDMAQARSKPKGPSFEEGEVVLHKLFGRGNILELRGDVAIVKFDNPRFNVRKLDTKFLEKG